MTTAQLARAAGADLAWLHNAERLLGRRFARSIAGSREVALIRMLHADLDIDLATAAGIAKARKSVHPGNSVLAEPGGAVTLLVDPQRFDSVWLLNLAAALELGPRLRGRPLGVTTDPVGRARRYGIDIGLLRWQLSRSVADRLDALDGNKLPRIQP